VVANGGNPRQRLSLGKPAERVIIFAVVCDRLPIGAHGKQGVCRGLPPVAGGPLPEKEGVDLEAGLAYLTVTVSPRRMAPPWATSA
jgi:hypothetical protein